jgi:hopanoid biosynthesis associated radical SAM protein HpnH
MLNDMGVEGMMVAPGFQYKEVAQHDIFMQRDEARTFFKRVFDGCKTGIRFYNNPMYLDFLMGRKEYDCTQWSTPTYTPAGWRRPCYLIADEHAKTYAELMETKWDAYGFGKDPRCDTCMMHCGYEGSAIQEAMASPKAFATLAWRSFRPGIGGRGANGRQEPEPEPEREGVATR